MPGGRPFTFDREDIKEKAKEYLESEGYKTITSFCVKYRISRKHFYRICEEDEELRHIGEAIQLEREQALEEKGLSNEYNAGMARFALAQCGWSEKQEIKQDHTSKGESLNATVKFVTNKPT